MISPIKVINRLTKLLNVTYPNVEVTNRDIREGFTRPCFFIDLEDVDTSRVGTYYRDALEMRLYYFAANTYTGYIDLLHKRDELIRMLQDTTRLSDEEEDELYSFVIQANDDLHAEISKRDKALQIAFTVLLVQDDNRLPDAELITELEFSPNVKPSTDLGRTSESVENEDDKDKVYSKEELDKE